MASIPFGCVKSLPGHGSAGFHKDPLTASEERHPCTVACVDVDEIVGLVEWMKIMNG
jgi:hypothetical protein